LLFAFNFGAAAQNAKSKTEPLKVGATAPDFTLTDQNGKSATLSKAKKTVVLVFYRGYW
jgi:peroxiredoxin